MKLGPFKNCDINLVAIDVEDFHAGMGMHEIPSLRPKQALIARHLDNNSIINPTGLEESKCLQRT